MSIDVVAPAELTAEDIAAWRRLQDANPRFASPYLSPDWVLACAAVDGPDARSARVAIVREGAEAVGFFATRLSRFTAMPVGMPLCDYQGIVHREGLRLDPRALVKAMGVARLDFTHLLADQAHFEPFWKGQGLSHVVDIRGGYAAFEADRRQAGTDILKDAAKKLRKLEREQGAVTFTPLSDSREAFEQLVALKRAQYRLTGQTDIFEAGWPLHLLRNLFERRERAFGGAFFALNVDGRPIAMHFSLRRETVLHCWFIGHDREFDRYSPGLILMDQVLRWGALNGVSELDLGPGDYSFKVRLANRTRPVAHGFVGTPSPATLVRSAQYGVRQAAEALPLGRVSALPGKAMRRMDVLRGLRP